MENSQISDEFQQEQTFEYHDNEALVSTGPTTPNKQRQILISVDISPDKFLRQGSKPIENTLKDRMISPKNPRFEKRQGSPVALSDLEVLLATIVIFIVIMTTMLAVILAVVLATIATVMFVLFLILRRLVFSCFVWLYCSFGF
ncbi:hypothetical protein CEXT_6181 [Caerostris extrusa]|uniref:Uncharacterized protein n=1 Tax=Caerostris extrusa TaxID=172846 RepID=A0AAV4VCM2_CAEEX|nr:hypothetical protein CEXT_6181 [Caerostris extrusa]